MAVRIEIETVMLDDYVVFVTALVAVRIEIL